MPYLPETIESLFRQTVPDFKILAIVDDCDDGSVEYMASLRDTRLKIIRQPKSGLTPTLNRMLRESETPWLVRQDADDVSYPNRIERIIQSIKKYPDAGMFYSWADYHPKERCIGQFRDSRGEPQDLRKIVESGYLLSFCHTSVALSVKKTLAVGGYRENLRVEDADLWWRMALAHEIRCIPETLVGFRQNEKSLTSSNLLRQEVELLYIQYHLLSRLQRKDPQDLEAVKTALESFVSSRDLRAKENLRSFNIQMANRRYRSAAIAAVLSVATSPSYFLRRLIDEFGGRKLTRNGVSPARYSKLESQFWPA
jgi:glycosyltransferase involved in cell wall biosynthesis